MTDLMDAFYTCAKKVLVENILNEDGEYFSRTRMVEHELKQLNAAVDKNTAQRVDDLLTEQLAIGELRECACFRAGFRMALELTR